MVIACGYQVALKGTAKTPQLMVANAISSPHKFSIFRKNQRITIGTYQKLAIYIIKCPDVNMGTTIESFKGFSSIFRHGNS